MPEPYAGPWCEIRLDALYSTPILSKFFNGIGLQPEGMGELSVALRDGGIEVMRVSDGKLLVGVYPHGVEVYDDER